MEPEPARRLRDVPAAVGEDSVDVLPLGARERRRLDVARALLELPWGVAPTIEGREDLVRVAGLDRKSVV